ncbi:MAG: alpha/beta fold hydrolase [Gemmatimonadota bacterium]|jgi:pimeloyl-ACP methyl ester carboxylesterase
MGSADTPEFVFPVGYERFHRKQLFNFQLNRPYSLGYARAEDLIEAGKRIGSFAEWKKEMLRQADLAVAEERLRNAAFYVRATEFYTFPDDPDKVTLYDRFRELFLQAFPGSKDQRIEIPYGDSSLPAIDLPPKGSSQGTILLHGGYDSFIEEFYSLMWYFSERGYRVIGFDGPGQGDARRRGKLPLDYRWEYPVRAVLDYTDLEDVTLIGLSMGGYFALRAASLEGRVRRVIASGHAYDYMRVAPRPAAWLLKFFCDHFRDFTNRLSLKKIRQGGMEAWNISHLMYVLGVDEPMAGLEFAMEMNAENLRSNRVRQDVLVLASRNDHFIPFGLHREQLRRLTSARSVTERVFSKADHAENHCQIGNIGLALRVMAEWISEKVRTGV